MNDPGDEHVDPPLSAALRDRASKMLPGVEFTVMSRRELLEIAAEVERLERRDGA